MKTKLLSKRNFITLVVAILAFNTLSARDWFVKANASGEGASWDDPANINILANTATPGGALTIADGDVIYMAAGTYSRTTTITLTKYVSIIGGYPVLSTATNLPTRNLAADSVLIVAGNGTAKGLNINATTTPGVNKIVVDGLNFENFTATGTSATALNITSSQADIEIKNCDFIKNFSLNANGGAVYMSSFANVISISFDKCKFLGNQANTAPTIANGYGGAAFFNNGTSAKTINFTNCIFKNNKAYGRAAALYFTQSLTCNITDCVFDSNHCTVATDATSNGGTVYVAGGGSAAVSIIAERSVFLNSYITGTGSVFWFNNFPKNTLSLTNCSLIGNYSSRSNSTRAAVDCSSFATILGGSITGSVLSNYNWSGGVKASNKADVMYLTGASTDANFTFANSILNGDYFLSSNTSAAVSPTILYKTIGFLDELSIALALSGDLKITDKIVLNKTFIAAEAGTYAPAKIFDVKRLTGKVMTLQATIPSGYKLTIDAVDYSAGEKTINIAASASDPVITLAVDGTTATKSNLASKFKFTSTNGLLSIDGLNTGDVVKVYNANGQLISNQIAKSNSMELAASGFIIVKINSFVSKILVK
jgi:hypothetical protein